MVHNDYLCKQDTKKVFSYETSYVEKELVKVSCLSDIFTGIILNVIIVEKYINYFS